MPALRLVACFICLLFMTSYAWAGAKEDYEAAGEAMERGDKDQALRLYEAVVQSRETPKAALYRAYHFMGVIHLERKDWKQAYANFATSVEIEPGNALARLGMGRAWAGERMWKEAVADYSKAIQIKPDLQIAYVFRAEAYRQLGETQKAEADVQRAGGLKIAPGSPPASPGPGAAAASAPPPGKEPSTAEEYARRADGWGHRGQFEKALADLDQAIRLKPDYAEAYFLRAMAKASLERYPEALADAEQAIKIKPGLKPARAVRGNILFLQGRFAEAALEMEAAGPSVHPNKGAHLLWLYLARERGGQPSRDWLASQAQGLDLSQWPGVIISLFLGQATPQNVNGQAVRSSRLAEEARQRQNQAYFFLAQHYLLTNRRLTPASTWSTA